MRERERERREYGSVCVWGGETHYEAYTFVESTLRIDRMMV